MLIGLGVLLFFAPQWQPGAVARAEPPGKVVYDPSSGSYFEIIRNRKPPPLNSWKYARADVEKRVYKGIRGRLAVIKTLATHEFLKKHLGIPFEAWIGLRYHCSSGKLIWVNGELLRRGVDFEKWHSRLYYEGKNYCKVGVVTHLVVFYTRMVGLHTYWMVSGPVHVLAGSIVEYPTR